VPPHLPGEWWADDHGGPFVTATAPERFPMAPPAAPGPLVRADRGTREGLVAAVIALGALLVLAMWWHDTSPALVRGTGPWLTSAGRVTGLVGTYLVVVEVLLMGRVAWLDRLIGMDRLAVWHRRNGEYSIGLLVAHAALTIWGYAVTGHEGLVHETTSVVLSYPDMLAATVGLGLLVGVGIISGRALRRRVSYHTWYFIHLYTYLALALSFAHQFNSGADFATHPGNRAAWIALYALVGVLLLSYRVGKPVRDLLRHRLRVARVIDEGAGLVSVYITGRRLDELAARSGQFFLWRFLTADGWWQAHPYSLSSAPNGKWLRLTVKALGDHSTTVAGIRPGTRVLAEGPYGAFTADRRRLRKVLLIGAGVGITPLRALFESLPGSGPDVQLVFRARSEADLVFRAELDRIALARGSPVHYVVGPSSVHPEHLGPDHLIALVPDVRQRDVFVCGPAALQDQTVIALRTLGVRRGQIHTENFEL
jgi:predicted ferric reductase